MSQDFTAPPAPATPPPRSNLPEYTVSEISAALRRTVEAAYGQLRVRGEISRPKRPGSGHIYLTLKDEEAVLEAVIWRTTAQRLTIELEDGMEVVCTGRLTTFPGQSKYQLVIDRIEAAGEGALLKMLENRRRRLAAEGLFDAARKRPLPFLPGVIGVITSPTGAVIRDILHRLADRFPRHVLIWPVPVQGVEAPARIAEAIAGFNGLAPGGRVPRPDVLIVARGGGSLEDLMAFNEEVVVRAAAASAIPLIAAVGHETDTTLIDHAADRRAPTPSAAAEMAVPVRALLLADVADRSGRLLGAVLRGLAHRRSGLEGLSRGLGDPQRLLEAAMQRLDDRAQRLERCPPALIERGRARLAAAAARLPHPRQQIADADRHLGQVGRRLAASMSARLSASEARCQGASRRLRPEPVVRMLGDAVRSLRSCADRLPGLAARTLGESSARLSAAGRLLESYSYRDVLRRGFAVIHGPDGHAVTTAGRLTRGMGVDLELHDGRTPAVVAGDPPRRRPGRQDPGQGSLL